MEGSAAQTHPTSKEEWKTAHANKNAFATFSIPLFFVQRCHPKRQPVALSAVEGPASPCHPDRAKRVEGSAAFRLTSSSKEEWKTAHANKNAFATFSIPLFFIQRWHPKRQPVVLSVVEGPVYPCHPPCHLERQSRGLLEKADSSAPVLRTSARNDTATQHFLQKISEKAKTVEKRNSFPGFSFFDGPSFALFLFLSCGDAGVSAAFGLVVLVWFIFLFIFAYE